MSRLERDSMGEIAVPDDACWGAQTQRSIEHFAVGERMPLEVIHALARIKQAAARVNRRMAGLADNVGEAIERAADEVATGALDAHFPLVVYQTGSGTQSNMNVNEVVANRASELLGGERGAARLVHPNDDVNRSQSSNDAFPTAMAIAAVAAVEGAVLPALDRLAADLAAKARAWDAIVKIGRTHLMDATPLTLGQEASGWTAQVVAARAGVAGALNALTELPIGGTAVGTGLNAPRGFGDAMCAELSELVGRPFLPAPNRFAALAGHDALVAAHGALRVAAVALMKIAADIRLLASGPRAGLGELILPANEPGSSIMPGKVNPTQVEMLTMVCARVMGNDVTVGIAGASGQLELNVMKPVLVATFLESARLIAQGAASFAQHAVAGLAASERRIAELVERSLMLVTALAPTLGYDRAAEIAKYAQANDLSLRDAAAALDAITPAEFDRLVRPADMIGPAA
jgi:fumarate hydratase, class II